MNDGKKQFDKRFLILGDDELIKKYSNEKKLKKIIRKLQKAKLPGIWGTLGWKEDKPFNVNISNSKNGNSDEDKRDISTINIIDNIKSFNSDITNVANDVVERYINLELADFGIDWTEIKTHLDIPELRLDLFVDDTEGAMVYYYHQLKGNLRQLNDKSVFEQFIQCQKTDDNYTTKRDRLTNYFKVLPPNNYTTANNGQIDWDDELRTTTFIIKIITFKRKEGTPGFLLKDFFNKKNIKMLASTKGGSITYDLFGKKKYGLLIYDNHVKTSSVASSNKNRFDMRGAFFNVDDNNKIDRSKKTLLLIHGTFSNTLNSFKDLVRYRNEGSELEDFLNVSQYKQVIAFNHPTVSADVFDNIKVLKELLGEEKFEQGIGILAASRGCVLAQAIGADKALPFFVDKGLLFSPANGVAYFNLRDNLATGLSILKKVTKGTPANYAFALLQFSADYFMDQPGPKQMTFKSNRLDKVLKLKLANSNSQYTVVVNDWEKGLIDTRGKRFWMRIADGIVKLILGSKHDFVVGVKGQKNMPQDFNVTEVPMASTHCKYFTKSELHNRHGDEVVLSTFMAKYL